MLLLPFLLPLPNGSKMPLATATTTKAEGKKNLCAGPPGGASPWLPIGFRLNKTWFPKNDDFQVMPLFFSLFSSWWRLSEQCEESARYRVRPIFFPPRSTQAFF